MTVYQLNKNKIVSIFFIYLCIPWAPLMAFEYRDYLLIDKLVKSCYKDNDSCNLALIKINSYQKNAAKNKKFSCQTRLLGVEANLIMAMNFNFKHKEAKRMIQSLRKYC